MGLGRVLDDQQTMFVGDGLDRVHFGRLTVQVYRHNGFGSGGDRTGDPSGIEVVGFRIVVDQNGSSPGVIDAQHCCNKRVRGGDDLITRPDSQALHCQCQRVQPAADADAVLGLAVGGKLLLESRQVRAGDEISLGQNLVDGRSNLGVQLVVQPLQVDQWYGHGRRSSCAAEVEFSGRAGKPDQERSTTR